MKEKFNIHRNNWTDADVERHWDNVADIYVDANDAVEDAHTQRYLKSMPLLKLEPGTRVLNITSRDCEADDYIHKVCPSAQVVNAEISQGLIDVAVGLRPKAKQAKIKTYSELPFENSEFDRILTLETLEHVENPTRFLQELHRVSIDEAVMVLSCPPATCEPAYRIFTKLCGGHGEGPHRFLPSKEVKVLFRETGWELILHEGTLLLPVGPRFMKLLAEKIIVRFQNNFIAELGIRQLYVCKKQ